ncbi:MAG: ABC transporter permease [Synergistaceae bacterium]|nr:ABC transporter permease [Synergistaceae bacterium]
MRQVYDRILVALNVVFFPLLVLFVWQMLAMSGQLLEVILPSPLKVWSAFVRMVQTGLLARDLSVSFRRVLTGYLWGASLGLILGVVSGLLKFFERFFGTIVDFIRQIPPMAWMPLLILWFGIGETSKAILIAKSVFVPVFINTIRGVHGTSREHIELSRVLELSYSKYLRRVIIPSALPSVFTGLRLGVGAAWMSVVAAEMLGGITGVGYALIMAKDFILSDQLIAMMFVIGIVGLLTDAVLGQVERFTFRWKKAPA